jgi:hypothetical protein
LDKAALKVKSLKLKAKDKKAGGNRVKSYKTKVKYRKSGF